MQQLRNNGIYGFKDTATVLLRKADELLEPRHRTQHRNTFRRSPLRKPCMSVGSVEHPMTDNVHPDDHAGDQREACSQTSDTSDNRKQSLLWLLAKPAAYMNTICTVSGKPGLNIRWSRITPRPAAPGGWALKQKECMQIKQAARPNKTGTAAIYDTGRASLFFQCPVPVPPVRFQFLRSRPRALPQLTNTLPPMATRGE